MRVKVWIEAKLLLGAKARQALGATCLTDDRQGVFQLLPGAMRIRHVRRRGVAVVCSQFIENVGHYSNLKVLKGDSVEMAKTFNGNKVDMVFIDAGHTYDEVIADIEAWLPKCKKMIAGHDFSDSNFAVKQAVLDKFDAEHIINVNGSVWWVEL